MKKRLGMDSILREETVFETTIPAKSLTSFLRCDKDIANSSRYFGQAWLNPSKIIISTCKRLSCLSACKTSTS